MKTKSHSFSQRARAVKERFRNPRKFTRGELTRRVTSTESLPQQAHSVADLGCAGLKQPRGEHKELAKEHHHVGTFQISSSIQAIEAAVTSYASPWSGTVWSFDVYVYAVGQADSWQAKIFQHEESLDRHEHAELEARDRYEHQKRIAEERYYGALEKASETGNYSSAVLNTPVEPREKPRPSLNLTAHQICFTNNFRRADYTKDLSGYLAYIRDQDEDVYQQICVPQQAYLTEKLRKKHTYLVGSSGSGKTELLKNLIHCYVTKNISSVVVLDPNNDFTEQVVQWKEFTNNARLVYLKHNLEMGRTFTINPFEISGLDPDDKSLQARADRGVVAEQLTEAFIEVVSEGGGGGEFTTNMKGLLNFCIKALVEYKGATLRDLIRLMDDDNNDDLVSFAMSLKHSPDLVTFFTSSFPHRSYGPTKQAVAKKINFLLGFDGFGHATCGKSTIDLSRFMDEKRIIVFNLSKGSFGTSGTSAFGRLMVGVIKGIAVRRDTIPEEDRVPCHFFLDECHNFLSPSIKEIMKESRKYRLYLTMAQQTIGMDMSYDLKKIIHENAHLKLAGMTGVSFKETADYLRTTVDLVESLDRGRFIVAPNGPEPRFVFSIRTDLLGNSNRASKSSWELLKAQQLRFYRDYTQDTEPTHYFGEQPTEEELAADMEEVDTLERLGYTIG